ncbi:hypothetical protein [Clostridium formicaceticum]|uniref:Uncharacterized protein n=1 Tax=Clostridium formicaceticum TaxID=1497 RepID=A0AAC9RM01_9CLOT|nr:hypothetical protein [Clostridium formicaceticum]AOY75228.1 hypothetical protein BJL90_04500 [Clostridium formicaceticum]ARE89661.1 hypothetical protein CLFO_41420 [Clostridium formicaceticum]
MPWKQGKIKLADGTVYPAELLVENGKEIWNVKIHKGNNVVEEIDADSFAHKLNKNPEDVYPFSYELDN